MTILFWGCTINSLFPFPLEKVCMVIAIAMLIVNNNERIKTKSFITLVLILLVILTSFFFNVLNFSFLLFFPLFGVLFAVLVSNKKENIDYLYYSLWIHAFIGLIYVVHSYIYGLEHITRFVRPMFDKGLPFLHAPLGFTPTVQSFGTMCLGWLLLYFYKKENSETNWKDRIMLLITILSIIVTFNRNTFVLFVFILMIQYRKLFMLFVLTVIFGVVYYIEFIMQLVFNVNTMSSRKLGLEGFTLSYLDSDSLLVYLFGKGDNLVPFEFASKTTLGANYNYIENGAASILHCFGLLGFIIYGVISISLVSILFFNKKYFLAAFTFYLLLIGQLFTNEYFASTFYLLIAIILLISETNDNKSLLKNENRN